MRRLTTYFTVIITSFIVLVGCDGLTASSPVEGQMRVLLTDAPADIVEANVVIQRVELFGGGGGVIELSNEEQEFDLLELQDGITAELADVSIPEGRYSQLRLVVADEAHIVLDDGTDQALTVPSGAETGIKVLLPEFDIEAEGDAVEVLVDFDVEESFVKSGETGRYIFKPVIKPVYLEINGVQTNLEDSSDGGDS